MRRKYNLYRTSEHVDCRPSLACGGYPGTIYRDTPENAPGGPLTAIEPFKFYHEGVGTGFVAWIEPLDDSRIKAVLAHINNCSANEIELV
jgi:hypothetical protein